ncbi:nucleotide pyrophosphohydrolase [Vagococcus coleopterorum]|uniref:Nucleotide pyrophosphohydrolase n=1 Tax=Vagococcus coleopterorum TaxID=2714946 RepID=A0A6G8ANV8_9ENTE|nr:nucleotide pyrophosphohydrolase [Vagococcus coleopterorum]QIL46686.1 nucleotide pyrophosphohydrolase [Vagococcus coleopterorum]
MEDLLKEINQFRDERDWRQYHSHKDLAISVSLEASELLENFQWKTDKEAVAVNKQNIQEEIADVYIYLMMLADDLDLDIKDIVRQKLTKNAEKYPVDEVHELNQKAVD